MLEDRLLLAYSDVVVADNPLVYYQFEEADVSNGQTAVDTANVFGGDNTATYNGTLAINGSPAEELGGQALNFQGTDDFVTADAPVQIGSPSGEYSIELWFNADSATATQDLFAASVGGGHAILLELQNNGGVRFLHRVPTGTGGGQSAFAPAGSYVGGQWHHLVAVNDGADMRLYLDGAQVASATPTGALNFPTDVTLGRLLAGSNARSLQGSMDEVAIYNRVLTEAEIQEHRNFFAAFDDDYTTSNPANEDAVLSVPASGPTVNLALGGVASQSSTGFGGVASRANDGNTNPTYGAGSVTHTASGQTFSWWQVDLGGLSAIDDITVYNRGDCCGGRLSEFRVAVYQGDPAAGGSVVFFQDILPPVAQGGSLTVDAGGVFGDFVRVSIDPATSVPTPGMEGDGIGGDGSEFLSLAEVEVMGQALTGVLANDRSGNPLEVSSADTMSASGAAVNVAADGSFTYDPTSVPALQALAVGETATDTFTYTASEVFEQFQYAPGLLAGSLTGDITLASNPGNLGAAAGPQAMLTDGGPRDAEREAHWTAPRADGGSGPGTTTLIYSGQVFLQSGVTHFIEANDDKTRLSVDNTQIISDDNWNAEGIGSFNNTGPAGWFDFEARFSNGGGGYGFSGNAGWGTAIPAGFLMGHESVIADPADQNDPDYAYPEDSGSMNLFRHAAPSPSGPDGLINIVGIDIGAGGGATDTQINNVTEAEAIYAAAVAAGFNFGAGQTGDVTSGGTTYNINSSGAALDPSADWGGAGRDFSPTNPYPGVSSSEDFLLHAEWAMLMPAGTYTVFGDGDDGFSLSLSGVTFTNKFGNGAGQGAANEIRFENTTGAADTGGTFTLASDTIVEAVATWFERAGGDFFELSIRPGASTAFAPDGGNYTIISDGAAGISLSSFNNFVSEDSATVTVLVEGANDAPTVAVDTAAVSVDEGSLVMNTGTFDDIDTTDVVTVTSSVGVISNQDTGNSGAWEWSYTPGDGPDDSQTVTVTATDSQGATDTATFTLTVNNVPPTGVDDADTTDEDTVLNLTNAFLAGNDTDPAGVNDPLTVTGLNGANTNSYSVYGAVISVDGSGNVTYDPTNAAALQVLSAGESIMDSFTYTVDDGDGGTGTATVTVTVTSSDGVEINTSFDHVFEPFASLPGTPVTLAGNEEILLTVDGNSMDIDIGGMRLRTGADISAATPVSVVGGAGNMLSVDDSADAMGDTASIDFDSIDGLLDSGSVVSHSGVGVLAISASSDADTIDLNNLSGGSLASVTVNGNAGEDTFITTPQSVTVNVNGNSPVLPADPGDTLVLDLTAEPVPLVIPTTVDGSFNSSNVANAPINWLSIENFIINGEVVPVNRLFVEATSGSDRIIFFPTSNDEFQVRINNQYFPSTTTGFDALAIEAIEAVGREGSDRIIVAGRLDIPVEFDGGLGNDYLAGGINDDTLIGGDGNDILLAGEGDNVLSGGIGSDRLEGRDGNDIIFGGDGTDRLVGNGGNDILDGGNDNDFVFGGLGDDLLVGGSGTDTLQGHYGNDVIFGGDHADQLFGGYDDDILFGGAGIDRVRGDVGNDDIIGGNSSIEGDLDTALAAMLATLGTDLATADPTVAAAINAWQSTGSDRSGFGTLIDDGAIDDLAGGNGIDPNWTDEFHSANDYIRDLRTSEGDSMIP